MSRSSALEHLAAPVPLEAEAGWKARLELEFERRGERTCIVRRRHEGPLVVQRPFYPESNGCCHVYLVHPPGGVVGGDELELTIALRGSAHALVTTPAATKLYRSQAATARITQKLNVGSGSTLEWLPQETIAFDGSRSALHSLVELEAGAAFIGSEVLCLGRPAAKERFLNGSLCQKLELWRAGRPLLRERLELAGAGPELEAAWGLSGFSTLATLVAVGATELEPQARRVLTEHVRRELPAIEGLSAVTAVSGAIVCRYLGNGASAAQLVLRRAWQVLRPELLGCSAVPPRIWAT